mgnify:CR=1 FL=1|tara:strand:- start:2572 stop:3531 length:960 start_codon:yes stop_codon:yes gene_type:complete
MAKKKKYYNPCLESIADEYTRTQVKMGVGSFFCANVPEKTPEFDKAPCETVIKGAHNSFVVLGRDRNESWASGAGGAGLTECGMIDLVAGRGQLLIEQNKSKGLEPCEGLGLIGPGFHFDAARVYITQKTLGIDEYFAIPPAKILGPDGSTRESKGPDSKGKSAVGIKADQLRLISREKIRIYCGRGKFEGFEATVGETNSLGQKLDNQVIELQVGDQELHPMVLGRKLVEYLKKQNSNQRTLLENLLKINVALGVVATGLATLSMGAPPFSAMAKDHIDKVRDNFTDNLNTYINDLQFLDDELMPGYNHILSSTVFTT